MDRNGKLSEGQKSRILSLMEKIGSSFKPSDVDRVESNLDGMNKGPVASIWDKVEYLWNKFRTESTPKEKALIIGALLYLIMPLDILPDAIPGVGLIDDVFAILFVFNKIVGIGRSTLRSVGERVMERLIDPMIEKEVRLYMEKLHAKRLISSLVNLIVYVFAVLLVIFPIFGTFISSLISSALLSFAIGFAIYRFVKLLRGRYFIPLFKEIVKEKDVRKGLSSFIRTIDSRIVKIERFSDGFFRLLGEKSNEKTLDRFIDHTYRLLKKDILRFVAEEGAVILVFFLLRYYLMHYVSNLSFWQIVFYPYVMLFSSF